MHRQVVLDTETTGIRVEEGHRIIEIGCVELVDRKLTGKHFHSYLNPGRDIEIGALSVHGITQEFLKDKPVFETVVSDLIEFIIGAELIIHNAPFDLSFLNYELKLLNSLLGAGNDINQKKWKKIHDYCQILDTLPLARQLHAGQRNTLDALCKRYSIDNSKRELHGALLDAHLLAQVYLAMTGGQGNFFETLHQETATASLNTTPANPEHKHKLFILRANENELFEHNEYLLKLNSKENCIWLKN